MYSNLELLRINQTGLPSQPHLGQNPTYHSATPNAYPLAGIFQPIQQTTQPVSALVHVGRNPENHGKSIFCHSHATIVNANDSRRNGKYLTPSEAQNLYSTNTFPRLSEPRINYDISPVATYSGPPTVTRVGCNLNGDCGSTLPTVNHQNHSLPTQGKSIQNPRKFVFPHINVRRDSSPSVVNKAAINQIHVKETGKIKKQAVKLPPGCTGLINLGNTCYMNSVLQCLSHTKVLLEYCYRQKSKTSKGRLANALADVFKQMWSGAKAFDPSEFRKKMLSTISGFDNDACQEDAQEFLLLLLEGLQSDLKMKNCKSKHISIRLYPQCDEVADSAWSLFLRAENGIVVDIFMGQQRSSLTCSSCNHVSHTFEPSQGLSLPIPKAENGSKVTLLDCLRHYFHKETLGGDEKPACSNCKSKSDATKRLSMQKFPKIFIIQLKRFSSNSEGMTKMTTPVHYPVHNLNFKEFAYVNANVIYNLYAVVEHVGRLDNGHYMATIRNGVDGNWYHYDDDLVNQVPENHAVTQSAYILFYELFSAEAEKPEKNDSVSNLNLKNLFIEK